LDVISVDTYPADNLTEIQKLPIRIADIERRYGKPVIVAEVGLQVAGKWTSEDQARFVPAAIEAAKEAAPLAIIVYQLRDEGRNSFGLIQENRTPRASFPASIRVMKY
jgi:arabinogalactan endo-1,4-beta-galactosidase